ncbi:WD40/YVTN/BNR-like repeat-containing protein [Actinomadura sp. HBU206391]|uniref:WD40/YVTN/BNR-like repeat-containing protein n=1 Tax=Actinomadura sp. HBU206391 TaxID=2731692 RepID=UPI0016504117|nr:hypothetical protein [Actinomadura sp. HBU206391]MBC6462020.1 hypothetical protein [Actinomadura sp. HBU206391]
MKRDIEHTERRRTGRLASLALIGLGSALAITGCGSVRATGSAPAPASDDGAPPIDAALVTPGFGWVLTADRLLISRDSGATFTDAKAPVPASSARAAVFRDASNGYVTAASGDTITIARTSDGGRTWQTGTARDAAAPPVAYGRMRIAFGDASHGVILAKTSSSAMSSAATLFATTDGGASWAARSAPVAGEVAVDPGGRTWLAGGVADDELHSSPDLGRHWSRADLRLGDIAGGMTVAPPVGGVVPVTVVTADDRTEVALLTTADKGRTWRETNRVAVHGRTGPGVRVPVASAGAAPLVVDTAGGHAYRLAPRRATVAGASAAPDLRPPGLADGAHAVTFAADGRTGWALATYGRCASGKSDCVLYHPLMTTADGGATWRQARLWRQRLD